MTNLRRLTIIGILFFAGMSGSVANAQDMDTLFSQWNTAYDADRFAEAERIGLSMVANSPTESWQAASLQCLARAHNSQGNADLAIALYLRAMAIPLGSNDVNRGFIPMNLGNIYRHQGRYAEADRLYRIALDVFRRMKGENDPDTAMVWRNLAWIAHDKGDYAYCERLHLHVLAIRKRAEPDSVHDTLNALGDVYRHQGRYADSERFQKSALDWVLRYQGAASADTGVITGHLAHLYRSQGRYAEAETLQRREIKIDEAIYGADNIEMAIDLSQLGDVCQKQGRLDEAERHYRRALDLRERHLHASDVNIGYSHMSLAWLEVEREQFDEAESHFNKAIAFRSALLGESDPDAALCYNGLGLVRFKQGRHEQAIPLLDRSIATLEVAAASPDDRFRPYLNRARAHWELDHKEKAFADLTKAMALSEQQRVQGSGTEDERALFFGQYAVAFEQMVAWRIEMGNPDEAFVAAERMRARELISQMEGHGQDLLAGLSEGEKARLRQAETVAKQRVAQFERQLVILAEKKDLSDSERVSQANAIGGQLRAAREDAVDAHRDIRNASPALRRTGSGGFEPAGMTAASAWAAERSADLLSYVVGEEQSFVFVLPFGAGPYVEPLAVTSEQATELGIPAGPLTAKRLREALVVGGKELPEVLESATEGDSLHQRLHVLWQVLIPSAERERLAAGSVKQLVVSPDGPLASLPFEMLVVEPGEEPRYLLDVGPPTVYVPSATLAIALSKRPSAAQEAAQPVLTVGDPIYPVAAAFGQTRGVLAELTPRARFRSAGGALARLPHSGVEARWVADSFKKHGIGVGWLTGDLATENALRANSPGRRIVHIACHGLSDNANGNRFGALALTPGKNPAHPADDGFLTLAEIYELNLTGCELTVLSACQTNFGPTQQGEGVWSLARGFLVAGSRRVVASNWLVDDEAAASLVSYFAGGIAQSEAAKEPVDYAQKLHDAKRWVRQQEKWQSPFHWGAFVLVGPN